MPSLAAQADALDLTTQAGDEPRATAVRDVAGYGYDLDTYMSGDPECMWDRRRAPKRVQCVSLYVSTSSSCGVSSRDLMVRGVAILSLVSALQMRGVAITLHLVAELDGQADGDSFQVIQVESAPLDLSTAAFALAHPAFARQITYSAARQLDGAVGKWPRSRHSDGMTHIRKALGCADTDIIVPGAYLTDGIMTDPQGWLASKLAAYL